MYLIEINTFICCTVSLFLKRATGVTSDARRQIEHFIRLIKHWLSCRLHRIHHAYKLDYKLSNLSVVLIRRQIMSPAKYNLLARNAFTRKSYYDCLKTTQIALKAGN